MTPTPGHEDDAWGDALSRTIQESVQQRVEDSITSRLGRGKKKPDGIVTILFTDVEGSSDLVHALGDKAARAVLRRHDEVVRRVVTQCQGVEVEHPGDSFMVAFLTATRAIECGLSLQPALDADAHERRASPVRIRVGMDTGEVIVEDDGYFGRTVFRASRIADLAAGGQVLVSETTRLIAETAGFAFQDFGERSLKGLGGSHHLFEVVGSAALPPGEVASPPG
jgi:class 3 adenylate cyclase